MPRLAESVRARTPPQIADRLGVSVDKVLAWIHSGELKAANLATHSGGRPRWRVDPADLEAFLERRAARPTPKGEKPRRKRDAGIIEFF